LIQDFDYVKVQWGIWQAGAVAVPLCITHPLPSLQYVLEDTGAAILVISPHYHDLLAAYALEHSIRLIVMDRIPEIAIAALPAVDPQRNAMILYTSGTTNKPKGVVTTHTNIAAQINSIASAWQYAPTEPCPLCFAASSCAWHHQCGICNTIDWRHCRICCFIFYSGYFFEIPERRYQCFHGCTHHLFQAHCSL